MTKIKMTKINIVADIGDMNINEIFGCRVIITTIKGKRKEADVLFVLPQIKVKKDE